MMQGRKIIDDICVLNAEHIIPFKMYAWLNNKKEREEGKIVGTNDINKHKNDVFRLYSLINTGIKIKTFGNVKKAINDFLDVIRNEDVDINIIGRNRTKEEIIDSFKKIYLD